MPKQLLMSKRNQDRNSTVRSVGKHGAYAGPGEYESTTYLTRGDQRLEDSASVFTKPSSRKIGERIIPSIELHEPLEPHRPYSSSQTAKRHAGLAHRKYAARVTSKISRRHLLQTKRSNLYASAEWQGRNPAIKVQNLLNNQNSDLFLDRTEGASPRVRITERPNHSFQSKRELTVGSADENHNELY